MRIQHMMIITHFETVLNKLLERKTKKIDNSRKLKTILDL